jgi:hypothetical protein
MVGTVAKSEIGGEGLDRVSGEVSELLQKWDNRLRFPFSGLAERYCRGDLAPIVNIRWDRSRNKSRHDLIRTKYTHAAICNVGLDVKTENVSDNDEFSVLVDSVQVVNEPEEVPARVWSRVGLQFLDPPQGHLASNSLYFSLVFVRFVFLRILGGIIVEDGELDTSRGIPPIFGGGKLPCDVIKCRPKMVDDFTGSDAPLRINAAIEDGLLDFLKCLPILIGPTWIGPLKIDRGNPPQQKHRFPV